MGNIYPKAPEKLFNKLIPLLKFQPISQHPLIGLAYRCSCFIKEQQSNFGNYFLKTVITVTLRVHN